jgi:hypothetical protein
MTPSRQDLPHQDLRRVGPLDPKFGESAVRSPRTVLCLQCYLAIYATVCLGLSSMALAAALAM